MDKQAIFDKGKVCWYCAAHLFKYNRTIDHIIPSANSGTDDFDNLVPCCRKCNSTKRHYTLEEFRAIMGRPDDYVWFSKEQKQWLQNNFDVDVDSLIIHYIFSFERRG